jgi:CRISPR/Cas system Type II protein with McrA/HNH and RuvC-like nuclease domain
VSYKRFTDNVPLAVDREITRGISRDILKVLNEGLGIYSAKGHEICAELARESNTVHDHREELMNKMERLRKASLEFDAMGIH